MTTAIPAQGSKIEIVKVTDWLKWCSAQVPDRYVALPMIQRGFVWKPHQIIDLWDSLLRGMPVGSLLVNTVPKGTRVRRVGSKLSEALEVEGIGLLDGQQRTLAMLTGWVSHKNRESDTRVWIDLLEKPGREHLFRLRVTTRNHPFGFQLESPSAKLSVDDRRKADAIYRYLNEGDKQFADFRKSLPYSTGTGFALDLSEVIDKSLAGKQCLEAWVNETLNVHKKYKAAWSHEDAKFLITDCGLASEERSVISGRIDALHSAITRMASLEIPLIYIDSQMDVGATTDQDVDPALAILFRRVGSGGAPLSNDDYIYSVIKHRWPEAHDLVEGIYKNETVAALLSPTDIVATAVRLAATICSDEKGNPLADNESIDKNQFHRLLNSKVILEDGLPSSFMEGALKPLIGSSEKGLSLLFLKLQDLLTFKGSGDIGLPPHALVLLDRQLIQVLLYWLMRLEGAQVSEEARKDCLRFVLYWSVFVTDSRKASRIVFSFLKKEDPLGLAWVKLYKEISREGSRYGLPLYSDNAIKMHAEHCVYAVPMHPDKPLVGWRRFAVRDGENQAVRECRELYQRWWTHGRGYVHPILLWLQREYVCNLLGNPIAGREEDTPYDYDHILPQSHWSHWTGVGGENRILDFMDDSDKAYHVVGNGIGNVRVWSSSDNRSDGDASPKEKLPGKHIDSLVANLADWDRCSPYGNFDNTYWDKERSLAFQRAVEVRALQLYKQFYSDLGFVSWEVNA